MEGVHDHLWRRDDTCDVEDCQAHRHPREEPHWLGHIDANPGHRVITATGAPATCTCGAQAKFAYLYDDRLSLAQD